MSHLIFLQGPARSVDDEETEMVCPLCNVALYNVSLMTFNQHVDGCLNRQTIKELIHEQDMSNYKRQALISTKH